MENSQIFKQSGFISGSGAQPFSDATNQATMKLEQKGPLSYKPPSGLKIIEVIGNGSFGVVYKGLLNGEEIAVKRVFQDRRYKNREKDIISVLDHWNIIRYKQDFMTKGERGDVYLNLVMEFMNCTLSKVIRDHRMSKQMMNIVHIRLYAYQMLKALSYLKEKGICHRDLKPQNILVNYKEEVNDKEKDMKLKICDFGSAKKLKDGEKNLPYICSRYYRAPELIFKSEIYTNAIDMWSIGCVIAEMILGEPLFAGENSLDQLVEIVKVLGTPTRQQIQQMNPSHRNFDFPQIQSVPWSKVFEKAILDDRNLSDSLFKEQSKLTEQEMSFFQEFQKIVDLISLILVYAPQERPTPLQALSHPFFHELRNDENAKEYKYLLLFDFSDDEKKSCSKQISELKLIPDGYSKKLYQ